MPFFVLRVQAHQANVDDFLYARIARSLIWNGNPVGALLHTGTTSPLVPALSAPGADLGGLYGALAVELPLYLLVVSGAFILARTWLRPLPASATALVVGLNVAVITYSQLLNFALASSAAVLWTFAAYIRSDRLRTWRWSLVCGASFAALLLSRSVAPAYAVPLAAVLLADLVVDVVRTGNARRPPALAAVAVVVAVAGPWWVVSGPQAVHYLLSAGYQPSSGYTTHRAQLTPVSIGHRIGWTLVDLGWGESWVLAAGLVLGAAALARSRKLRRVRLFAMVVGWAVLTLLVLSTSANQGTGFGLPVLCVVIVCAGVALAQLPRRALQVTGAVVAGVLVAGLVGQLANGPGRWWPEAAYRSEVVSAGGTLRTNTDQLTAEVAAAIGSNPTLLVRDDGILNSNGIGWAAGRTPLVLKIPPNGPGGTRAAIADLAGVRDLVTGSSFFPYLTDVDQTSVGKAAAAAGFRPVRRWVAGTYNDIVLWTRGGGVPDRSVLPVTRVVKPHDGAAVRGPVYLAATATGPLGVARVVFEVRGPAGAGVVDLPAQRFTYGWLGGWDTTAVPDGTYVVRSVATDAFGATSTSPPVTVRVDNAVTGPG